MTEEELREAIEELMRGDYIIWTIGITNSPDWCKKEYYYPPHWHCWETATDIVAEKIEMFYLGKGCKCSSENYRKDSHYVYIF